MKSPSAVALVFFFATLLLTACGSSALAQGVVQVPAKGSWWGSRDEPHKSLLYEDQRLIGEWDHNTRTYRRWTASGFTDVEKCPFPPPDPPAEVVKKGINQGLMLEKMVWQGYADSGVPVSREQAFSALEQDLPDDRNRPRITVQGSKDSKDAALRQLREWVSKKGLGDKVILWSGLPDDLILARRGFKPEGDPTVWVQDPDGRQLLKAPSFKGEATLAEIETTLARWDPRLFPGLRSGGLFGVPGLTVELLLIVILFLFCGYLWLRS